MRTTYFINTSGRKLDTYRELMDIELETRKLIMFHYPISDWSSDNPAYLDCKRRIGDLIDSHTELSNDFRIVVYVDLTEFDAYMRIPESEHIECCNCLDALHTLLQHYIGRTLIAELTAVERVPAEVTVLFSEGAQNGGTSNNQFKSMDSLRKYITEILAFPDESTLSALLTQEAVKFFPSSGADGDAVNADALADKLTELAGSRIGIPGFYSICRQELGILLQNYQADSTRLGDYIEEFLDAIGTYKPLPGQPKVRTAFILSNIRARKENMQVYTMTSLRICRLLIGSDTIADSLRKDEPSNDALSAFEQALCDKRSIFQQELSKIAQHKSFIELDLAPAITKLDLRALGMDEHGAPAVDQKIVLHGGGKKKSHAQNGEGALPTDRLHISDVKPEGIYTLPEYKDFEQDERSKYPGEELSEKLNGSDDEDAYLESAKQLRAYHYSFFKKVIWHMNRVLSHYAMESKINERPLLGKRTAPTDAPVQGYGLQGGKPYPTGDGEVDYPNLADISEKAYSTAREQLLDFCANRMVTLRGIDEQFDWLATRINQIAISSRRIKRLLLIMLIGMLAVYIPYVVIQWQTITSDFVSLVIALCSLAGPILLYLFLHFLLNESQKKKYQKAWSELRAKSEQALEDGTNAVLQFDELLKTHIPILRCTYNYQLHVRFFDDCCRIAAAKLDHHRSKLTSRIKFITGLLNDLKAPDLSPSRSNPYAGLSVDYNLAYCVGEHNPKFYSVDDPGVPL